MVHLPLSRPSQRQLLALTAAVAGVATLAMLVGRIALQERQHALSMQPPRSIWGAELASAPGAVEEVWIKHQPADGEQVWLNGLWLPQAGNEAPVLLYLHGVGWDVRSSATRMRRLHSLGFAVLGIDYRGFGTRTYTLPSEALALQDARAAWDWLAQRYPGRPRYIFGHSLGGAIAVELAAQVDDVAGVIVEGTFTSLPDVLASLAWGWLPLPPFIAQRFASIDKVANIGSPLLVVHGSDDKLIPHHLGRALFDQAREPKRFVLVPGGSHHDTNLLGLEAYRQAVGELFGLQPPG